jgi:peptidyl-dipeptidase Dcp
VSETFFNIQQANSDPAIDKIQSDVAPLLAAHQDTIYLNSRLFARVKAVYDARATLKLGPEAAQLLTIYYRQFLHAGANLSDADKARLKAINKRDAGLEASFQQKLVAATKAGTLVLDNKADLTGLIGDEIANAAHEAQTRGLTGKFVIPLQNTTQQPLLLSLSNRDVREKLFNARWTATEETDKNDTRATIAEIAQLRAEKAKLLG